MLKFKRHHNFSCQSTEKSDGLCSSLLPGAKHIPPLKDVDHLNSRQHTREIGNLHAAGGGNRIRSNMMNSNRSGSNRTSPNRDIRNTRLRWQSHHAPTQFTYVSSSQDIAEPITCKKQRYNATEESGTTVYVWYTKQERSSEWWLKTTTSEMPERGWHTATQVLDVVFCVSAYLWLLPSHV